MYMLLLACRGRCSRLIDSTAMTTAEDEKVVWIPSRLLVAASRDTEMCSFILDTVFRAGLFPTRLSTQAAAQQWVMVNTRCCEQDRSALLLVLRAKARAQQEVQSFLTARGGKCSVNPAHSLYGCIGQAQQTSTVGQHKGKAVSMVLITARLEQ